MTARQTHTCRHYGDHFQMILGTHLLALSTLLVEPVRYRRRHHHHHLQSSKIRIAPFEENVTSKSDASEPVIVIIPVKPEWNQPKQRGVITSSDAFTFKRRWPE
jgi:hypothetical protein